MVEAKRDFDEINTANFYDYLSNIRERIAINERIIKFEPHYIGERGPGYVLLKIYKDENDRKGKESHLLLPNKGLISPAKENSILREIFPEVFSDPETPPQVLATNLALRVDEIRKEQRGRNLHASRTA